MQNPTLRPAPQGNCLLCAASLAERLLLRHGMLDPIRNGLSFEGRDLVDVTICCELKISGVLFRGRHIARKVKKALKMARAIIRDHQQLELRGDQYTYLNRTHDNLNRSLREGIVVLRLFWSG